MNVKDIIGTLALIFAFLLVIQIIVRLVIQLTPIDKFVNGKKGLCRRGIAHFPNGQQGFDGASFESYCKFCHKHLLQDSQGNWFTHDWRNNELNK